MSERYYRIKGGIPLDGIVEVLGAKNAVSKQLVASVLTNKTCIFTNVPPIAEITQVLEMLSEIGSQYEWLSHHTLKIQTPEIKKNEIDQKFQKYTRIPILFLGPLLGRTGRAKVPIPGGCKIGSRPVDFHIAAVEAMGAKITATDTHFEVSASLGLKGTNINLAYPSVGATENVIFCSVVANGKTIINNAAIEPEIIDTINCLNKMVAQVKVRLENRHIEIDGRQELKGTVHHAITDRIEAASFAIAAVATDGFVTVKNAQAEYLSSFLGTLTKIGGQFSTQDGCIIFFRKDSKLKPTHIETDVHPGFMTDWQQPFTVMLTQADGTSVIHETVYEKRFGYAETLARMGADINVVTYCLGKKPCRFYGRDFEHSCVIKGPSKLRASNIEIPDLRAGFAHIIAALIADGTSNIYGINLLERGYASVPERLRNIGAQIEEREC